MNLFSNPRHIATVLVQDHRGDLAVGVSDELDLVSTTLRKN